MTEALTLDDCNLWTATTVDGTLTWNGVIGPSHGKVLDRVLDVFSQGSVSVWMGEALPPDVWSEYSVLTAILFAYDMDVTFTGNPPLHAVLHTVPDGAVS